MLALGPDAGVEPPEAQPLHLQLDMSALSGRAAAFGVVSGGTVAAAGVATVAAARGSGAPVAARAPAAPEVLEAGLEEALFGTDD